MLDEHFLARAVAGIHAAHLRQRHVRFVDEEQPVFRKEVDQAPGRRAGLATGQVTRVILDAVAVTDLAQHVKVVARAHLEALRFEQLAVALEVAQALVELRLDRNDRAPQLLLGRDEMLRGKDEQFVLALDVFARHQVHDVDRFDLVAEEGNPVDQLFLDSHELQGIAAHPERSADEVEVVAPVLHVDELTQQDVAIDLVADANASRHLHVVRR